MSNAIQKTSKRQLKDTLQSADFLHAISQVLPRHMTPDRMARTAIAAMTRTPKLAQCNPQSVINAMMDCSQLGLEPDGRRAHLIPYKQECKLIIDYKGMVELVMRTGLVANIHADVICDNDEFVYNLGKVEAHRVNYSMPRGEMYAAYCVITMKDGTQKSEVMTLEQIEAIRKAAPSANSDAWRNHYGEMAKKTVFRRCAKWVPWESENTNAIEHVQRLEKAFDIDNSGFGELSDGEQVGSLAQLTDKMIEDENQVDDESDDLGYGDGESNE